MIKDIALGVALGLFLFFGLCGVVTAGLLALLHRNGHAVAIEDREEEP